MSTLIYTYSDPYLIDKEYYWDKVSYSPYFTASQTLANGMRDLFSDLNGHIAPISKLLNNLYPGWYQPATAIKQHGAIDNVINSIDPDCFNEKEVQRLSRAFAFNRDEVFKSIRILFELGVIPENVDVTKITKEQRYLLEIYKRLNKPDYKNLFTYKTTFTVEEIDQAIANSFKKESEKGINSEEYIDTDLMDMDTVVIQGIHQFQPLYLKAIELISQYKEVVLLFNYNSNYKNVFQTWIDIYSLFQSEIEIMDSGEDRHNLNLNGYSSNVLAENFGKIIEGKYSEIKVNPDFEIKEYDNVMEFASYVSDEYEKGRSNIPNNPLKGMETQFYSANNEINSILKIYYPEQFGERQFLNYPLGHFFMAIADMWNSESNTIEIVDLTDIKECFNANIIAEKVPGELNSVFERMLPLFQNCKNIDDMIKMLKRIKKQKSKVPSDLKNQIQRLSYYRVSSDEIDVLIKGLSDLKDLAATFYEDFEKHSNSFKEFYKKMKIVLQERMEDYKDLDNEFTDIIKRVLERIELVQDIDVNASFDCLKSTMTIYLQQEQSDANRANWIARNFEQIDGDVLLTNKSTKTYHFAYLNDDDLIGTKLTRFDWPLNSDFFEVAQMPVDWKYQVYVKSKEEYKNFKRYALFYGLYYNKSNYELSYIKHNGEEINDLFYLLKILNPKIIPYEEEVKDGWFDFNNYKDEYGTDVDYINIDYYKFNICKYKFLIESLIEGNTVYKDSFLTMKYMEVLIENKVRLENDGLPLSPFVIRKDIEDAYNDLHSRYFPFVTTSEKVDIIKNVGDRLSKLKNSKIDDYQKNYMMLKELFVHRNLIEGKGSSKMKKDYFSEVAQSEIDKTLDTEVLFTQRYYKKKSVWCEYCPNREICGKKVDIE